MRVVIAGVKTRLLCSGSSPECPLQALSFGNPFRPQSRFIDSNLFCISTEALAYITGLTPSLEAVLSEESLRVSLLVQWLRLRTPDAGVVGSVPGQGTKNLYVEPSSQKKKKKPLRRSISGIAFMAELFFTRDRIQIGLCPCDAFQVHEKLKYKTQGSFPEIQPHQRCCLMGLRV